MNTKLTFFFGFIALLTVFVVWQGAIASDDVLGSAPSGLPNTQASSATSSIGTDGDDGNANTIFALNPLCTTRIISTTNQEIMLSFTDLVVDGNISSTTLTGGVGILQSASTTVAYDSGIYGCGRVTGFSAGGTTTITGVEME